MAGATQASARCATWRTSARSCWRVASRWWATPTRRRWCSSRRDRPVRRRRTSSTSASPTRATRRTAPRCRPSRRARSTARWVVPVSLRPWFPTWLGSLPQPRPPLVQPFGGVFFEPISLTRSFKDGQCLQSSFFFKSGRFPTFFGSLPHPPPPSVHPSGDALLKSISLTLSFKHEKCYYVNFCCSNPVPFYPLSWSAYLLGVIYPEVG